MLVRFLTKFLPARCYAILISPCSESLSLFLPQMGSRIMIGFPWANISTLGGILWRVRILSFLKQPPGWANKMWDMGNPPSPPLHPPPREWSWISLHCLDFRKNKESYSWRAESSVGHFWTLFSLFRVKNKRICDALMSWSVHVIAHYKEASKA